MAAAAVLTATWLAGPWVQLGDWVRLPGACLSRVFGWQLGVCACVFTVHDWCRLLPGTGAASCQGQVPPLSLSSLQWCGSS